MQILGQNSFLIYIILLGTKTLEDALEKTNKVFEYCYTDYEYISIENLIDFIFHMKIDDNIKLMLNKTKTTILSKTAESVVNSEQYLDIYNNTFILESMTTEENLSLIKAKKNEIKKETTQDMYISTTRGPVEVTYRMLYISTQLASDVQKLTMTQQNTK